MVLGFVKGYYIL